MFGAYRFLLALMVAIHHLWYPVSGAAGVVAVYGFYILSGYLMTKIVAETYRGALVRYAANRFLRIYPMYWTAAALGLAIILVAPEDSAKLHPVMRLPETFADALYQVTIFGLRLYPVRIIPSAFSLHLELIFYILIGLGIGLTPRRSIIWFCASIGMVVAFVASGSRWLWAYHSPLGVSICFAAGSLLYHLPTPGFGRRHATAALAAVMAIGFLGSRGYLALHTGAVAAVVVTAALRQLPRRRWDDRLGNLAYPLFLFHHQAGGIVAATTDLEGGWFFAASLALALVESSLILLLVDRPITHLRNRLRTRSKLVAVTASPTPPTAI